MSTSLPNIHPRFYCCQTRKSVTQAGSLAFLFNVSSLGNNQIYKHTVMKQRKGRSTHRESELKKNPVEPQWAKLMTNIRTDPQMKVLGQSGPP